MKKRLYIGLFMLVGTASLFLCSCNGNSTKGNTDGSNEFAQLDLTHALTKDSANYPVISVVDSLHEFGEIKQGNVALYAFPFRNTGSKPLIIDKVTTTCGCTIPDYPEEPIPPGGYGKIEIAFHSEGKSGRQVKPIFIHANTHPGLSQLTITCNVVTPKKDSL